MEENDETFWVTIRNVMDVLEVYDVEGNKVLEVAVLDIYKAQTSRARVKLGFRGKSTLKYVLVRSLDDVH
jgi:hypothetical protein